MKTKVLSSLKYALFVFVWMMACGNVFSQNFSWAQKLGDEFADNIYAMQTDAEGSVYVMGSFRGTVDFDPGPATHTLQSPDHISIFVGKYSGTGSLYWVQMFLGSKHGIALGQGCGIAVDKDKNVYTTGSYKGTLDLVPGSGTHIISSGLGANAFVCKLAPDGHFEWVKEFVSDSISAVQPTGIAVDGNRNIYTTGSFIGLVDFDPGDSVYQYNAAKPQDAFVSKLDADGNFLWAKRFGGPTPQSYDDVQSYALALDADGAVYTTGSFQFEVDFDPGPGQHILLGMDPVDSMAMPGDVFISKLDADGNLEWVKQMGSIYDTDRGRSIAVDAQKNVYTVGDFTTGADLDPGPGTFTFPAFEEGKARTYIHKLDGSGNFVWARYLNDDRSTQASLHKPDIALDGDGDLYVGSSFAGTVEFDVAPASTQLTAVGPSPRRSAFVGKWNAAGGLVWVKGYGGPAGITHSMTVAVDAGKNVYAAGAFTETTDFNPDAGTWNLTSGGSSDAFLLKLSPCAPTHVQQDVTLCKASYQWPLNGQVYAASGEYWSVGESSTGCDSVVVMQLALEPASGTVSKQVCSASYVWPLNGVAYTASGVYRDTLSAGACDSVVTLQLVLNPLVYTEYVEACHSYTWPVNGQTYTQIGMYTDTLSLGNGCDSVRTLMLLINTGVPGNHITEIGDGPLVTAEYSNAYYEWLDCDNGFMTVWVGTGAFYFQPSHGGSYAVAISKGGCVDTSDCYLFESDLGMAEAETAAFKIFPNPVQDKFQITSTGAAQPERVEVTDLNGRTVYSIQTTGSDITVSAAELKAGVYFVKVVSGMSQHIYKIIKMN